MQKREPPGKGKLPFLFRIGKRMSEVGGSQVGVTHQIAVHLGGAFRRVPLNAGKKKRRPRWVGKDSSGTPLFRITRILYKCAEKDSSDSCTKCGYTATVLLVKNRHAE